MTGEQILVPQAACPSLADGVRCSTVPAAILGLGRCDGCAENMMAISPNRKLYYSTLETIDPAWITRLSMKTEVVGSCCRLNACDSAAQLSLSWCCLRCRLLADALPALLWLLPASATTISTSSTVALAQLLLGSSLSGQGPRGQFSGQN